jgi:hypothetical protein
MGQNGILQPPDESNISVNWKQICSVSRSPTPGWKIYAIQFLRTWVTGACCRFIKIIMAEIQNKAKNPGNGTKTDYFIE